MGDSTGIAQGVPGSAFEADPAAVYAFVDAFFEALVASGVAHVCISPGSRSTPLAIAAARQRGLETWVGLDERASSFFALGLAKASRQPVALVCTSGTAAANYHPAVIEAHYSRVPLLVLTADRPPELRDWGAGQTIDQPGLYGRYPRWASEVPIPTAGEEAVRFALQLGARAVNEASGERPGPVHLNWPFREPLAPPLGANPTPPSDSRRVPGFSRADAVASETDVERLVALARSCSRGVLCAGPMEATDSLRAALLAFSEASGWPILAGPASQLRDGGKSGRVFAASDGFLRSSSFAEAVQPECVIRIGETPVSKVQRLWLEACRPDEVWWLDEGQHWGEPSHSATHVVRRGGADLLGRAAGRIRQEGAGSVAREAWIETFRRAERRSLEALEEISRGAAPLSGLSATATVTRVIREIDHAVLFASNSMSIRLLDLTLHGHVQGDAGAPRVLCSRGASGIDGIPSTALGIATAHSGPTLLLTGDLAFLHDLSGLLATRNAEILSRVDLVIVVLDDDGGGIFSFLPVAEQGAAVEFDRLFGTPHGVELERVADLYDLDYHRATDRETLEKALRAGFSSGGIHLIHVPLDRSENEARFRESLARVVRAVDAEFDS